MEEVTSTVMVQVLFAGIEPPESTILPPPAVAVNVPPQEFVVLRGVTFVIAAGYVSVKAIPVNAVVVLELVRVKVSVLVPPDAIGSGEKFLAIEGGSTTVKVSVAVLPVPPLVEVIFPVVLVWVPAVEEVTSRVMVQLLFAAIVPPAKAMLPPPAVAVSVPPQVLVVESGVVLLISVG